MRVVAGIVRDGEGRVLLGKRSSGNIKGFWEFPGGKVREGETDTQALVREFMEEFSLKIIPVRFLGEVEHRYPDFKITLAGYLCRAEGEIKKMESHSQVAWVPWNEVRKFRLAPADRKLLEKIEF